MVRFASFLALVLALVGCGQGETSDGARIVAAPQIVALETLVGSLQRAPDSDETAALIAQLGEPDRVEVETLRNRYDPAQHDTVRTFGYDTAGDTGVEVVFYQVGDLDKTFAIRLTVTDPAFVLAGVHVGSTRAEVDASLGPRAERGDDRYTYRPDPIVPDRFEIHFDGDVVSRIDWLPYWE